MPEVAVACSRGGGGDPVQRSQHDTGEYPSAEQSEEREQAHRPPGVADEDLEEVAAIRRPRPTDDRDVPVRHEPQQQEADGEQRDSGHDEKACVAERQLESDGESARSRHLADPIADAGHRLDDPRFAEPLSEGGDRDAHRIRERVGVRIPGALEEVFGADHSATGRHQHVEDRELLTGQRDISTVPEHFAAEAIEAHAPRLDDRGSSRRRAAGSSARRRSTSSRKANGLVR